MRLVTGRFENIGKVCADDGLMKRFGVLRKTLVIVFGHKIAPLVTNVSYRCMFGTISSSILKIDGLPVGL